MTEEPKKTSTGKKWPLTMTEAAFIARMPVSAGTDAQIAKEYGVDEALVRQIRNGGGYNGVKL